ncbi:MAG: chromate transporter [Chloroflexi bacterium]|nr:chromate transporter [Chloroflexota bacterium]
MNPPAKVSVWLKLFWMFLKVNLLTTSGPASVGLLYKESVGTIMSEAQFIEAVGLSNVLPGSEALKLAMFVGFAAGGFPGVLTALVGAVLPPTIIMLTVVSVLERYQSETWMENFIKGMSPAVGVLIALVAWQIFRSDASKSIGRRALAIGAVAFVALWFDLPSPLVLFGAGILGVFLFR